MKLSARNVVRGRVLKVAHGTVNSEVVIEVAPGIQIAAIITRQSAETLGLVRGGEAYAVIKASDVMVAVD